MMSKLKLEPMKIALTVFGGAILAFGIYNIHSISEVTEGGILGLTLFLQHWCNISPAVSGLVMNIFCYLLGWKVLGGNFILYSALSGGSFSLSYAIFEQFPPIWSQISQMPLCAAVVGAVFVGVGVGLSVLAGGAPTGDDALAMSFSKMFKWKIEWAYLISDLTVIALSATYINVTKLLYSLITVFLSGQIIGLIQRLQNKYQK